MREAHSYLEALMGASEKGIARSADLSRLDREYLLEKGFIRPVCKGWYYQSDPTAVGDAAWTSQFWNFIEVYGRQQLAGDYCLSAEASLARLTDSTMLPRRLVLMAPRAGAQTLVLPQDSQLTIYPDVLPEREIHDGLSVMTLPTTIARLSKDVFLSRATDVTVGLSLLREQGALLAGSLADFNRAPHCERVIAFCYKNPALKALGEEVLQRLRLISKLDIDPARAEADLTDALPVSSVSTAFQGAVLRFNLLWDKWASQARGMELPGNLSMPSAQSYMDTLDQEIQRDTYHSLTIEGYQVTPEMIEKVYSGGWDPEHQDKGDANKLALKGYWHAVQAVRESISHILAGASPGEVAKSDVQKWFSEMHKPMVQAGLLKPSDIAGVRRSPVYIRGSAHVPPAPYKVGALMEAFHQKLSEDNPATVRAALGHLGLVYIHPFHDGNGRTSRFLMNSMLASGGYPWRVIENQDRTRYFAALEKASVGEDVTDFARFVSEHIKTQDEAER